MDEIENPYRPGAGTQPPALLGRDSLLTQFEATIRRALNHSPGKSVMPIGLRGVGKTVLLNRFSKIARDKGVKVAYIEAPETGEFGHNLWVACDSFCSSWTVSDELPRCSEHSECSKHSRSSYLTDPKCRLTSTRYRDQPIAEIFLTTLPICWSQCGEAVEERGTGLLLAIDEVQYLSGDELAA